SITTDDLGNTGAGGPLTDADTVSVTISPVNRPPVNALPAPQTTAEDTAIVFAGANAISIGDVDAGGAAVEVTLTATGGTLTLNGVAGLTFETGDGTGDAVMSFQGTIPAINAALNGLTFTPAADFNGSASLTVRTDDLGNTGA